MKRLSIAGPLVKLLGIREQNEMSAGSLEGVSNLVVVFGYPCIFALERRK